MLRLAGELVVDDVVEPEDLRAELIRRFAGRGGQGPGVLAPPARRYPGLSDSVSLPVDRV